MLHCCDSVLACANDALHLSVKLSSDVYRLTGLNSVPNIYTGNNLHLYTLFTLVVCSMFRACMAPFIANNTAGIDSYKWILFGDDDTVFYVDNALRMLETLDHTMPYILSDHIWFPTDLKGMSHLLLLLCLCVVLNADCFLLELVDHCMQYILAHALHKHHFLHWLVQC